MRCEPHTHEHRKKICTMYIQSRNNNDIQVVTTLRKKYNEKHMYVWLCMPRQHNASI